MNRPHIKEEIMVDYVLGNVSLFDFFKIKIHLYTCKRCALELKSWENYLKVETSSKFIKKFGKREWFRQPKWLLYSSLCLFVIFLLIIKNESYGIDQTKENQANVTMNHSNELFVKKFDPKLAITYFQTMNQDDYYSTIHSSETMIQHVHQLTQADGQWMNVMKNNSNDDYYFIQYDESICLVDHSKMEITCILYPFYKNNHIFHPFPFESVDKIVEQ